MADLDAELLALAGGDSSGEESFASPPRRKSSTPPRPSKSTQNASADVTRRGVASKVKKAKRRRKYVDNQDEA
jgi:hypothetical protein